MMIKRKLYIYNYLYILHIYMIFMYLPISSTFSNYSGILQDCAWTHRSVEAATINNTTLAISYCYSAGNFFLMKQHNLIRRASRMHESWHETIDARSKIKLIPLPKTSETNQLDQFLLYLPNDSLFWLQSFSLRARAFSKARSATWSSLRTQTRRLVRHVRSRGGLGGWLGSVMRSHSKLFGEVLYRSRVVEVNSVSARTSLISTPHSATLCVFYKGFPRGRECLHNSRKPSTICTLHNFP